MLPIIIISSLKMIWLNKNLLEELPCAFEIEDHNKHPLVINVCRIYNWSLHLTRDYASDAYACVHRTCTEDILYRVNKQQVTITFHEAPLRVSAWICHIGYMILLILLRKLYGRTIIELFSIRFTFTTYRIRLSDKNQRSLGLVTF